MRTPGLAGITAFILLYLSSAVPLQAQSAGNAGAWPARFSLSAYAGGMSGGWSKEEESTAPGGQPVAYEFSSGAGAGLRAAFAITPAVAAWASAELDVEQEGPFAGLFGGLAVRTGLTRRVGLEARAGAGRMDYGPFGVAGASVHWFALGPISLGAGLDVMRPIGSGRRNNGLQDVPVDYDGGPMRLQVELGWHIGR